MSEGFMAALNFDTLSDLRRAVEERMNEKGVTKSDLGDACPAFLLKPAALTDWNKSELMPATVVDIAYLAIRLGMKFEITGIRVR